MKQHVIESTYKAGGVTLKGKSETCQGDLEIALDREIPAGAVNVEFDVDIPITTLLGICFSCNKKSGEQASLTFNGLVIKTNNTSTPGNTFTITPTNGVVWSQGDDATANPLPLTTAVTKLYVSNDGTAIGEFKLAGLIDSSPGLTG